MRYLLLFLFAPGSLTVLLLLLRSLVRAVQSSKQDDEDAQRAVRIQREHSVPDFAVSEPTGRRLQVRKPETLTSDYKRGYREAR